MSSSSEHPGLPDRIEDALKGTDFILTWVYGDDMEKCVFVPKNQLDDAGRAAIEDAARDSHHSVEEWGDSGDYVTIHLVAEAEAIIQMVHRERAVSLDGAAMRLRRTGYDYDWVMSRIPPRQARSADSFAPAVKRLGGRGDLGR